MQTKEETEKVIFVNELDEQVLMLWLMKQR